MVLELYVQPRRWLPLVALVALALPSARAEEVQAIRDARQLYESGQYFKAARYAFDAVDGNPNLESEAYSWTTLGLVKAGLHHSASYFFIRTLQSGDRASIRRVLTQTHEMIERVGPDLLRKYLLQYTTEDDYSGVNRNAFAFAMGKAALLESDERRAIALLNGVSRESFLYPWAMQLRGTARALTGDTESALRDFRTCVSEAPDAPATVGRSGRKMSDAAARAQARQGEDLKARCQASVARTLYQAGRFEEADREWDRIPKASFVWTDILFEQAWNAFAQAEYNRTLGRLVTYKAPALQFVYNSEVDVLRAQTFLMLCLYDDTDKTIQEFDKRYLPLGHRLKQFLQENASRLDPFYQAGKQALESPLHTKDELNRVINRFARGPYFQSLVASEGSIQAETSAIRQFDSTQPGVSHNQREGFPGFLRQVLQWRLKSIRQLGGAFVKNSLLDHHAALISDFEKMNFIKIEMLGRAKDKLLYGKSPAEGRQRGQIIPRAKQHQYYWGFNGEFWNDELGDYVFGLESQCSS